MMSYVSGQIKFEDVDLRFKVKVTVTKKTQKYEKKLPKIQICIFLNLMIIIITFIYIASYREIHKNSCSWRFT